MEHRPWHDHYDPFVPTSLRYPKIPAHEFLRIAASMGRDKAATDFFGTKISFYEMRQLALRMCGALAGLGVGQGDRVALHLPNIPQYIIAYYAVLHLGAVVVNVNPMYTVPELKHVLELTKPKLFVTFDMVLEGVRQLAREVDMPAVVVTRPTDFIDGFGVSTAQDLDLSQGWLHFSELLNGSTEAKMPKVQIEPEDPAVIIFTGGTTGTPKGATLSHANMVAATVVINAWGRATEHMARLEDKVVIGLMPFFHAYGQICVLNYAMYSLCTIVLVPRFDIDELMNILAGQEVVSFFPGVPTIMNAIVSHPRTVELELGKRLQLLNSGAAPMPVELIEKVNDLGINFGEGWGMSETTSLGIATPLMGRHKPGSIGIPFPDCDIRLVDPDSGEEVAQGQPGELLFKGPLVMQGYWDNPQETAEAVIDGWLHTGDIAQMDQDGYLYIVDRKKDMIIAGGYNVYPREIDEVLFQHPKIAEAVSIGVADEYRGETVKAYVVLHQGQNATEQEIIDFCRERLAAYKAPKIIEFRDELPKSAVGKILRKVLRAEAEQT